MAENNSISLTPEMLAAGVEALHALDLDFETREQAVNRIWVAIVAAGKITNAMITARNADMSNGIPVCPKCLDEKVERLNPLSFTSDNQRAVCEVHGEMSFKEAFDRIFDQRRSFTG